MTVKIIIAGSRGFNDFDELCRVCDSLINPDNDVTIVSGTAKGADRLGEQYAALRNYKIKRFPADWDKHGKKAGILRNNEMADYADNLIAFWDEESKGTTHMIGVADMKGLGVYVHRYKSSQF